MTLIFLDTETTGLDPNHHSVWEIAYAIEDGPVLSSFVAHSTEHADPTALRLNGYAQRFRGEPLLGLDFEADLRYYAKDATLVCSNPAFDAAFLRARWGEAPWHHRLWDISAYAAGVFGVNRLLGLYDIAQELARRGYPIVEPDHTAAADVTCLRDCFRALQSIREKADVFVSEPCS